MGRAGEGSSPTSVNEPTEHPQPAGSASTVNPPPELKAAMPADAAARWQSGERKCGREPPTIRGASHFSAAWSAAATSLRPKAPSRRATITPRRLMANSQGSVRR